MAYRLFSLLVALLFVPASLAGEISADRIKAAVAHLASDKLEGREPGTNGEVLTTEYLADEFEKASLRPIGEGKSYFQPVPLVRVITSPKSTLQAVKAGTALDIPCEEGFAGVSQTQQGSEEFDAEAVFLGHGITAPEFGWDDYQGVDVKGKIVVLFTNEPPSSDPKFFGGTALTYYGRWTYKYEEAARRGARACFIIHTNETAGYPYSVVRRLESAQLKREPGQPVLAFAGWLSRAAGEKLLGLSGRTVDDALREADTKGFKPSSLGVNLKGNFPTRIENFVSHNVVGLVEGSDATLKFEAIVFTAHWDHLGIGRPVLGDVIYNGAADNATGCGLLLELARAWSAQSPKPKRSAVFLAVTAEEKGLLGSKYYTRNPLLPLSRTALNLNVDMILPLGIPASVVVTGADRTTIWPTVKSAAEKNHLEIETDQRAHLGIFYRSDHFSMAQAGVPAFSIGSGMKITGKPNDFATKAHKDFNDKAYHSPQDEFQPDWDFSGFVVLAEFMLNVARDVANADQLPTWNVGDEFRPARDKQVEHEANVSRENLVIRRPAGSSEIVITTTSRLAGAVHSLTWNGKEFINSADHGRQLQSACSFDAGSKFWAEAYNPTEAGSRDDGAGPTSTSRLLHSLATDDSLQTTTQMAFWLAPRQKSETFLAKNTTTLSHHLLTKRVRIGVQDLPHVVQFETTFAVPIGERHTFAQFEALTGYMPEEFRSFWTFRPQTGELQPLTDGPGEQTFPIVFSTENGSHAMGIYSPQQPATGFDKLGYGRWRFGPERVVKWNTVFRVQRDTGIEPGEYSFRNFVVVGDREIVTKSLIELHRIFAK